VPVILISAYDVTVRKGFFRVLSKPFNLRVTAEAVAAALEHGESAGA
jgi:hypothetical protein